MPVAVIDGALGIEARHTWKPPQGIFGSTIPDFTLNDQAALRTLDSAGYAVKVKRIEGLDSLADLVDERETALGRVGEVPYDAEDSGKTVTYSGFIYGRTLQLLREGQNAMRRTFQAKSREAAAVHSLAYVGEGMMTISPDPAYGSGDTIFFGRAQSLAFGDEQQDPPASWFRRPFVLVIRMADPRIYAATAAISEHHLDGESIFVSNDGSAPTEPLFLLQGVFTTTPVVLSKGTQYNLEFTGLNGISDGLWVDFKSRRAWLNDAGIDVTAKLSVTNSNWWDPGVHGLDPGSNDIGVTGIGTGGPEWLVQWWHASV